MGYDMYLVLPPAADRDDAVKANRDEQSAAWTERNAAASELELSDPAAYASWKSAIVMEGPRATGGLPEDHPLIVAQHKAIDLGDVRDEVTGYFRLNIWGMRICRDVMVQRGMAFESRSPPPGSRQCDYATLAARVREAGPLPIDLNDDNAEVFDEDDVYELIDTVRSRLMAIWPEPADALTVDLYDVPEVIRADILAQVRLNLAWLRGWTAKAGVPWRGLPLHKFGSNDGWWVTKEECADAVAAHDAWVEANGDALPTRTDDDDADDKTIGWWPDWIEYLKKGAAGNGFTVH